jgi:hypothetical protein
MEKVEEQMISAESRVPEKTVPIAAVRIEEEEAKVIPIKQETGEPEIQPMQIYREGI